MDRSKIEMGKWYFYGPDIPCQVLRIRNNGIWIWYESPRQAEKMITKRVSARYISEKASLKAVKLSDLPLNDKFAFGEKP